MTFEKFNFILLAGGKSTRFGNNSNKSLITFRNSHLIENTLRDLEKWGFSHITLVYNKKDKIFFDKFKNKALLVLGGKERSDSVKNALSEKSNNKKYTIIHDLARPIIHKNTILKIIKYLNKEYECVVPYSKVNDTVIQNQKTINRNNLKLIKTPQGFITKELKKVHKKNYDGVLTDDSELFRIEGKKYKIKYFEEKNIILN
ncbi:MAG: hypothetical protein CMI90_01770 [Pelagibacteraceae bacterium]|nr:hypothetical protein [Pelagibacteraceae bacterium]